MTPIIFDVPGSVVPGFVGPGFVVPGFDTEPSTLAGT